MQVWRNCAKSLIWCKRNLFHEIFDFVEAEFVPQHEIFDFVEAELVPQADSAHSKVVNY